MKKLLFVLAIASLANTIHAISITIANKTREIGEISWAQYDTHFSAGPTLNPGQEVTVTPPMPGSFFFNSLCKVTNLTDKARYEITINGTCHSSSCPEWDELQMICKPATRCAKCKPDTRCAKLKNNTEGQTILNKKWNDVTDQDLSKVLDNLAEQDSYEKHLITIISNFYTKITQYQVNGQNCNWWQLK